MSKRIPRLEMAELDSQLRETLAPRVERLGYLGEFFKCTGHAPHVLRHFMEMTEALKKAVPDRVTETVALTVAVKTGNDYERNQHERLCVKLGFGHDWVHEVEQLDPQNQGMMSEAERAAQAYTLAAMSRFGKECKAEFERVLDALEVSEAIAVSMLVGRYLTHAVAVNSLDLVPPKPSIFEETGS
jgi:hypothetical protein